MPRAAAVRRKPQAETRFFQFLPESLRALGDPQKDLPSIAKDAILTAQIEESLT